MTLKEIAKAVLKETVDVGELNNWLNIDAYNQLLEKVYDKEVWNPHFRDSIREILKKNTGTLTMDEVKTYLTFIYATDRTNEGCIEAHINNGTIAKLMRRILELEGGNSNDYLHPKG